MTHKEESVEEVTDILSLIKEEDRANQIIQQRLHKYNAELSLDTFVSQIDGRWKLRPSSGSVYRTVIDRLSGDIVWFDRSWIATGTGIWKIINNGRETPISWSIDYDQNADRITWSIAQYSQTFDAISSSSAITMRISVPEQKVLVVIRSEIRFGPFYLMVGSHLSVK